ncbi:putative ubiquitin-protein ligase [Maudiozyma humilis]|uniref:E3 ubiquitin-protein ligase n=1 Tax=Maudiozyma humilis TaxID=51915 RepID=A0AAV5RW45_MAUHU|nr:putative ubiquitin-protein ligase [Kazachstania humilis]
MYGDRREPESLRDFLTYLPTYVENTYSESVAYVVWKTVKKCLVTDNDRIEWRSVMKELDITREERLEADSQLQKHNWRDLDKVENQENLHVGTMCNRQCLPAETVYYCYTCTVNPLYEVCEFCFDPAEHVDHVYTAKTVTRAEGRLCHCGNPSVFVNSTFAFKCKNKLNNDPDTRCQTWNEETHNPVLLNAFNDIFDYIIDVVTATSEQNRSSSSRRKTSSTPDNEETINNRKRTEHIPNKDSVFNELLIETTDVNELIYKSYAENVNIHEIWTIQFDSEDNNLHVMDLATDISDILKRPIEYGIAICDKLGEDQAPIILAQSDDYDKIKVLYDTFQSKNISVHIRRLHDVFKIRLMEDLVRLLYNICTDKHTNFSTKYMLRTSLLDSWKPRVDHAELEADVSQKVKINLFGGFLAPDQSLYHVLSALGQLPEEPLQQQWFHPWNFSNIDDPILATIMSNYDRDMLNTVLDLSKSTTCLFRGSRFQNITTNFFDKFSRMSSLYMAKIICTMFSLTDKPRHYLASQYLDVYLALVYNMVAFDPLGVKLGLMSIISQYTFQDPIICNLVLDSSFIERTMKFAFTLLAFKPDDLRPFLPIPLYNKFKLPSETIKNKKTIVCFKDMCVIMSTNTSPRKLLDNDSIFNCIFEAILQFSNILPVKRETSEHVEFENFDFSTYYFFFSSLMVMFDGYMRCISMVLDKEFRLKIVKKFMKTIVTKGFDLLSASRRSVETPMEGNENHIPKLSAIKEKICNHTTDVIRFQVGIDSQSFLNPTAYLFKSIIQWSQCGRYTAIPKEITEFVDFHKFLNDSVQALYISEASLSTLVLIGQINVGFWVRNGSPIMHQKRMYTKFNMRELTYLSDVFNVQFSMCMANPDDFMVTFLTRWGLKNWANGIPMGDYPDNQTTVSIVNECLLLLIQLLTESKSLLVVSSVDAFEKILKTEIIHAVAFNHCTYAQIVDTIPEHVTKHSAFEFYLEQYTTFTPASGVGEPGTFSLKEEYVKDLDPYCLGMGSGKRYEVEKSIRNHMKKKSKKDYVDTFVPVHDIHEELKDTAYFNLYAITSADVFGVFLKSTLDHIKKCNYENLLPRVIHLIHLCVVNNLNDFMKVFWHEYDVIDSEFYHFHSIGSILYSLLLNGTFINVHGKIREIFRVLSEKAPHIDVCAYLEEQVPSFSPNVLWSSKDSRTNNEEEREKKKKLAMAKRDKMLRKFSKQQMKFIANNVTANSALESEAKQKLYRQISNPETTAGWIYPEDFCAFCKIDKTDDVFVYFSYQEYNICDHGNDVQFQQHENDMESMKYVKQAPVLRTCGHGSHVKCLGNHMKSTVTAHTQTTKNIPSSYGFGTIYCPVCSSLVNSYLPKIRKYDSSSIEKFYKSEAQNENVLDLSQKHIITCKTACAILLGLFIGGQRSVEPYDMCGILSSLLGNSISNLEIRLRVEPEKDCDGKPVPKKIPHQCMLTFKLLSDLVIFSSQFLQQGFGSIEYSPYLNPEYSMFSNEPLRLFHHALIGYTGKIELQVYCFELIVKVLKVNCFIFSIDLLRSDWDYTSKSKDGVLRSARFSDSAKNDESTMDANVKCIIEGYCELLQAFDIQGKLTDDIMAVFQSMIKNALLVYLRRAVMIMRVYFTVGDGNVPRIGGHNELNESLSYVTHGYCKNYDDLIESFVNEYLAKDIDELYTFDINRRDYLFNRLQNMHLISAAKPHLIRLPHSLSSFYTTPKYEATKIYNFLGGESAICLQCGQDMLIQNPVALRGYKIGECTNHVLNECPSDSRFGLFLMLRTNMIYMSYDNRGTFYHSPYVNKYGETDEDLKYGTPVFLDNKRYDQFLKDVVLGNMVPHIVFRSTDGNSDQGGWETL